MRRVTSIVGLSLNATGAAKRAGVDGQRDLGKVARRPASEPPKITFVHLAAAQPPGRRLAHDPAQRLDEVGLAAAVRPDDAGQARRDHQLGRIGKRFETGEPEALYPHRRPDISSLEPCRGQDFARPDSSSFKRLRRRRPLELLAVDEKRRGPVDVELRRRGQPALHDLVLQRLVRETGVELLARRPRRAARSVRARRASPAATAHFSCVLNSVSIIG